ncbi:MAG TPA: histidine kinase [Terriglobales bacterium]|nr:histidine kinase [Terriglobales bacterium]
MTERLRMIVGAYWFRCALVSAAAGVLVAVLFSASGAAPLARVLPRSLVHSAVMGGLVGSLLPRVHHRLHASGTARGWTVVLIVLTALALAGTVVACALLELVGPLASGAEFRACLAGSFQINLILSLALGVGMSFYETQRGRVDALSLALRTQELEHERARKMALEARLASLESRLHPHFLFNTLNAITELIHESPARAERTVERLATLLRASLDATERGLVPLAHELELVRDYLAIEKERLGARLAYDVAVAPSVAQCRVPPLAVQTLVENSIKHAIAPRATGGRLRVEAEAAGGRLVVGVWDDGPGFTSDAIAPGHGLENLEGRLAARFGASAALGIARRDGGTLVTISVPRSDADGA